MTIWIKKISTSNESNDSDDVSRTASLDECTNKFIIKDGLCDVKMQTLKILKIIQVSLVWKSKKI